jgi:hypothetical protein
MTASDRTDDGEEGTCVPTSHPAESFPTTS